MIGTAEVPFMWINLKMKYPPTTLCDWLLVTTYYVTTQNNLQSEII